MSAIGRPLNYYGSKERMCKRIELTPYAEDVLADVYASEPSGDHIDQAWRFLIASWFGRGGDSHKTGFCWSKAQTMAPEITWAFLPDRLVAVAERLRGVCIRSDDALNIIDDYDTKDCLLFVDPPYPGPVGRRYKVKMADDTHARLAERLKSCRASVIMTMNPGTVYTEVLTDWISHEVEVLGGWQQKKTELILTNFNVFARSEA